MMLWKRRNERILKTLSVWKLKLEKNFDRRLYTASIGFTLLVVSLILNWVWLQIPVLVLSVSAFSFWWKTSQNIKKYIMRLEYLASYYDRQHERWSGRPVSVQTLIPLSARAQQLKNDFDLFGEHSVTSSFQECHFLISQKKMVEELSRPDPTIELIAKRQKSVQDILKNWASCVRLSALLRASSPDVNLDEISKELRTRLTPNRYRLWRFVLYSSFVLSIADWAGILKPIEGIPRVIFALLSFLSLGDYSSSFQRALSLSQRFQKMADGLKELDRKYDTSWEIALRRLDSNTSALSVISHPMAAIVINALMPWTVFFTHRAERLRRDMELDWPNTVSTISEFEVNFSYAHIVRVHGGTFASIAEHLRVENIFHPLLSRNKRVSNDFEWPSGTKLVLITGSNMSGKSTFLRTLAVNQCLAMAGAPVFASLMQTPAYSSEGCLRVSDSVRDGASYFYAEVRRLKDIRDRCTQTGLFYFIDEIFRGTNNRERLIGSQALIQQLLDSRAFGFITTHDLDLAKSNDPRLSNFHFVDETRDGELYFSYKIRTGPSPSTNALEILRREGLLSSSWPT